MTLTRRRAGKPAQLDTTSNSRRLTDSEEKAVVQYILKLVARSFPQDYVVWKIWPTSYYAYATRPLSANAGHNFVERQPELQTRYTRSHVLPIVVDVPEPRPMEGGQVARGASDGDVQEGAEIGASLNADMRSLPSSAYPAFHPYPAAQINPCRARRKPFVALGPILLPCKAVSGSGKVRDGPCLAWRR